MRVFLFFLILVLGGCSRQKSDHVMVTPLFRSAPIAPESIFTLDRERAFRRGQFVSLGLEQSVLSSVSAATLAAWIKPASIGPEVQDIIAVSIGGKNSGAASRASLRINPDGAVSIFGRTEDSNAPAPESHSKPGLVKAGRWQQITATLDFAHNQLRVYYNGKMVEVTAVAPQFISAKTPGTPAATITIGAEDDGSAFFFEGSLKSVGIWGRLLSQKEISSLQRR